LEVDILFIYGRPKDALHTICECSIPIKEE